MRFWKLAVLLFGCAACAEVTSPSDGSADEAPDGGSTTDRDAAVDAHVADDAGTFEDASVAEDSGSWGQLDSEEIATASAQEDIALLECSEPVICGGDPSGTWNVTGLCVTNALDVATQSLQNCPGILTAYERTASGTMGFLADGVMEVDLTITGTQHMVLDHACTQRLYKKDASDEVCAKYEEQLTGGSATRVVACTFEDESCHCDVESESSLLFTGTYEVHGNTIDDGATFVPFCAHGDELMMLYGAGVRSTALTFTRSVASE